MSNELNERVGVVENTLKNHEQRLQKQESNNEALIELKTIMKTQIEMNKQQNRQMENFSGTLDKINENLTHLNISQDQLKEDMSSIGSRVSRIEKANEESSIDVPKLMKNVLVGIVMLIPTIIGAWIMLKSGLK